MKLPIAINQDDLQHELLTLRGQITATLSMLETVGMTVHDPEYCAAQRANFGVSNYDFIIGDFAIKLLKPHPAPPVGKNPLTESAA